MLSEPEIAAAERLAQDFLEACERGKGWEACEPFCTPEATFAAQAEPIAHIATLADYAEWMKSLYGPMPNAGYRLEALGVDRHRHKAIATAAFLGTHTAEGGPVPPTGQSTESDYAYVMTLTGGRISHLTKIWHAGWAMRQLGWGG
jgi:ketosteroid isomerase-like protein